MRFSRPHSADREPRPLLLRAALALWCAAVLATLLPLLGISCAHTPAAARAEMRTVAQASNVVATVGEISRDVPAPVGPIVQGVCAVATGLLGLWNASLHRSVARSRKTAPAEPTAAKVL